MDDYELKQDIKRTLKSLREQRKLVTSSKEALEKFLTGLGIMHLFVPIKTRKTKSQKASAPKSKKAGKRKSAGK